MRSMLIVDDDPVSARLLEFIGTRCGYESRSMPTAESALRLLESGASVDLIVLDHNLGAMSGLDFFSVIHADNRFSHLPVIFCTGTADGELVREAMAAGIRHFVVKPVVPKVIIEKIAAVERADLPLDVVEPKSAAMTRLGLTDAEYESWLRTSQEHLATLRRDVEELVRAGNKGGAVGVAKLFRESANLLRARRILNAVDRLETAGTGPDFTEAMRAVLAEHDKLDAALHSELGPSVG
jgi:CheY-like chemotaxis protein